MHRRPFRTVTVPRWVVTQHAAQGCNMQRWIATCSAGLQHAALGCNEGSPGVPQTRSTDERRRLPRRRSGLAPTRRRRRRRPRRCRRAILRRLTLLSATNPERKASVPPGTHRVLRLLTGVPKSQARVLPRPLMLIPVQMWEACDVATAAPRFILHRCDIGEPAPVEMYSGCRCGRGEPSPAQTWQGQPPQCLPAAVLHAVPTVLAVLRHALRTADRRRRRNAAALGHRWMLPRCMAMPWSRSAIRGASTRVDLIRVALVRCCLEKKLLRLCANP